MHIGVPQKPDAATVVVDVQLGLGMAEGEDGEEPTPELIFCVDWSCKLL